MYDQIDGGIDKFYGYSNLGQGKWGLLIDDFLYNDIDMTEEQQAKVAVIDSVNTAI